MDTAGFLRAHPPFDSLADQDLQAVAARTTSESFDAGTLLIKQNERPSDAIRVIATGSVELLDGTRVVDVLEPGELVGHPSATSGLPPTFTARAREATTCYRVPVDAAPAIFGGASGLAFLSRSLRDRIMRVRESSGQPVADTWIRRVGGVVSRPPVVCDASVSVRRAAEVMTRERISSVLVDRGGTLGIFTDRDLRSRVVAEGRSGDGRIGDVMTSPVVTVAAETYTGDAFITMLERNVHHLPVTGRNGTIVGVVTDTDVMDAQRLSPLTLKREIGRAPDRSSLVRAARRLPDVVTSLVDASMDPVDIGYVVSVTIDALTSRMIETEIQRLGRPPAPWAWMALGSHARREQALSTDQDHLLAYDVAEPDVGDVDAYFASLAEAVTSGVEEAGIPRCRAGVSASEPAWRATLSEWVRRFRGWMADLGVEGSVMTAIAFDVRAVAGPLRAQDALLDVIAQAPDAPVFLRHLARGAVATKPPIGFLRDFVVTSKGDEAGTLDIKHGGIMLITSIARIHALARGSRSTGTLARLADAAGAGSIDDADRDGLEEAFRLLWQVRLEHQRDAAALGRPPDDLVDPSALGPITRQGLKAAFRMIAAAQRSVAAEFGISLR